MLTSETVTAKARSDDTSTPLSGEVFGALINLSGRRRFTSQRLALFAMLAAQGDQDAIPIAREALTLFRNAHTVLVQGDQKLPGIFCPELHEAYFGRLAGDRKILQFIELAERTLHAIEQGKADAPAMLQQLTRDVTPILDVLNQLTTVYEEQAKRHALLMRKQLRGIITDIESFAKQAKMVAFNARVVAARAGHAGKEFAVVAGVLSSITTEIDDMVRVALNAA
jgi:hypothetical protein